MTVPSLASDARAIALSVSLLTAAGEYRGSSDLRSILPFGSRVPGFRFLPTLAIAFAFRAGVNLHFFSVQSNERAPASVSGRKPYFPASKAFPPFTLFFAFHSPKRTLQQDCLDRLALAFVVSRARV